MVIIVQQLLIRYGMEVNVFVIKDIRKLMVNVKIYVVMGL